MDFLLVAVLGVVAIIATTALAQRIGVAAPLILVLLGVVVSFLPFVPAVVVTPELILAGVLPSLLYSAAVSLPAMDFRRDFTAISGLSVLLVVLTSFLLGLVFWQLIPELGFAGGVALGAIVSPTDAVATATVRRLGAPPRVLTARARGPAPGARRGAVDGGLLRRAVPGLCPSRGVARVGPRRRRHRRPGHRRRLRPLPQPAGPGRGAVELEHRGDAARGRRVPAHGARALRPGRDVHAADDSVLAAGAIAALAAVAVLVVRGAYLAPLLRSLARRARRGAAMRDVVERMRDRIAAAPEGPRVDRFRRRIVRTIADIDYLTSKPLGPREGVLVVWAGMRGVVTLAAAQSLPVGFPHRSFVVLVAFGVAAGTLLVQGGTLPWVIRRLGLADAGRGDPADFKVLWQTVEGAAAGLLADDALTRTAGSPYDRAVVERVRADVVKPVGAGCRDAAALRAQGAVPGAAAARGRGAAGGAA